MAFQKKTFNRNTKSAPKDDKPKDYSHPLDPYGQCFFTLAYYREDDQKSLAGTEATGNRTLSYAKRDAGRLKFDNENYPPEQVSTSLFIGFRLPYDKEAINKDGEAGDYVLDPEGVEKMAALLREAGYEVNDPEE